MVLPLLATQILWINLVTDGAPALALGVDPADDGLMDQPPRSPGERVITASIGHRTSLRVAHSRSSKPCARKMPSVRHFARVDRETDQSCLRTRS